MRHCCLLGTVFQSGEVSNNLQKNGSGIFTVMWMCLVYLCSHVAQVASLMLSLSMLCIKKKKNRPRGKEAFPRQLVMPPVSRCTNTHSAPSHQRPG